MVIGKIASIYNQAADSAQLRIRKKWFSKLSKKDFIKKLTNTTFFRDMKLDPEEKLFSGQGVFSNEKEAATWYDAHQIALNELKKESEDYNNDIKKSINKYLLNNNRRLDALQHIKQLDSLKDILQMIIVFLLPKYVLLKINN